MPQPNALPAREAYRIRQLRHKMPNLPKDLRKIEGATVRKAGTAQSAATVRKAGTAQSAATVRRAEIVRSAATVRRAEIVRSAATVRKASVVTTITVRIRAEADRKAEAVHTATVRKVKAAKV
ncbi:MAG: hypothetical protein K0Q94_2701, partial [Paenibacillus sp.]|nr:hypothetical protein [Paenibacillus sp.]